MAPANEAGRLQKHPLPDRVRGEIPVALNLYVYQLVPLAKPDRIRNLLLIIYHRAGLKIYLDVEVSLVLKIVAEIANAAHQNVAVNCPLVEHRDIGLQFSLGEFGARGPDFDLRSALHVECGPHTILVS